jgi:hypothetical protein
MSTRGKRSVFERVLAIAAPLTLAVVEIFHPHPHDVMRLDTRVWLLVHYLQIPLFPLAAWAAASLLRGNSAFLAAVVRGALFVFAVSFTAFDTAAGVVTGILVKAAQSSGLPEAWIPAVETVWRHPIVGGAPGTSPLLAVLGTIAWSVGLVGVAVDRWRLRRSWAVTLLLVVSAFGLTVFQTHAWPGGPVSFGALAVAAILVEQERD